MARTKSTGSVIGAVLGEILPWPDLIRINVKSCVPESKNEAPALQVEKPGCSAEDFWWPWCPRGRVTSCLHSCSRFLAGNGEYLPRAAGRETSARGQATKRAVAGFQIREGSTVG